MKKAFLVCAAILALAASATAQSATDSVKIKGTIILDYDELDSPEPFSGAGLFIVGEIGGNKYVLGTATTNAYGEFTFVMPKGEYEVGLWAYQNYKDYVLEIKEPKRKRIVDAQSNVYLGEWILDIESYFQYYFSGEMQKMKIDGVKVTVLY